MSTRPVTIHNYKILSYKEESFENLKLVFIDRINTITNVKTIEQLDTQKFINQWSNCQTFYNLYVVNMELEVSSGFYIRKFCDDFNGMALDIKRVSIN